MQWLNLVDLFAIATCSFESVCACVSTCLFQPTISFHLSQAVKGIAVGLLKCSLTAPVKNFARIEWIAILGWSWITQWGFAGMSSTIGLGSAVSKMVMSFVGDPSKMASVFLSVSL